MLSSLTLARRPRPQLPSGLLAVILILIPALAPCTFQAQTTNPQEISSRDVEPAFKLQSERNLVMVRVVVRDAKGATVDSLREEDFQLFDRGKVQTILSFSLEKPAAKTAAKPAEIPPEAQAQAEATGESPAPPLSPLRFLALYFDDVHTSFEGLARTRDAADHYLAGAIQPGDRVGVFTVSGQKQLGFTADFSQVHQALFALQRRPIAPKVRLCVDIPPYEAYLIFNQHDSQALDVATDEAYHACFSQIPLPTGWQVAQQDAQTEASEVFAMAEEESRAVLRGIEGVIRHLAQLPGQRSMIIVSDGFLTDTLTYELSELIDRALRLHVILNAYDARGLYADAGILQASEKAPATSSGALVGRKGNYLRTSATLEASGMWTLAAETGGVFFQNSNDYEGGFRRTAALPDSYYVLAFSPQNLKLDGSFRPLRVKLVIASGLIVQARKGYFAPRKPDDPAAQEKEEIREAVFSQDETHELPIDVHTQYFMKTESDAQIAVLTRIDLHPLHFRKQENRNLDTLIFVTAVFDRDGQLVTGQQKSLDLRLQDSTLEKYLQTGITVRTKFDVKPGTYLVRAIVRDSESGQISGLNRTVEIPY